MTASTYPEAIRRVLLSEGLWSDNPSDPGGPTWKGVTLATFRANGHPNATKGDLRTASDDEIKRIYKVRYAAPVHFDDDPTGLDYTAFDYAVNSGPGRANKVLRRVCSLPDDAPWPTLALALSKRDPKAVIGSVNAERLKFLQGLKTWPVFGKGWESRVQSVNAASLHMATIGAPMPSTLPPVAPSQGKGEVPKPKPAGPIVAGGTGGGAITSHAAGYGDWIMAHPFASLAILVAGLAVLLFIAEQIARRWQAHKQDAPTSGLVPVPEKV